VTTANIALVSTGRPEHTELEAAIRRALDQAHGQINDAESYAAAGGTVWAAPAPTTQDEAITRLAAAVAGLLGSPIP